VTVKFVFVAFSPVVFDGGVGGTDSNSHFVDINSGVPSYLSSRAYKIQKGSTQPRKFHEFSFEKAGQGRQVFAVVKKNLLKAAFDFFLKFGMQVLQLDTSI